MSTVLWRFLKLVIKGHIQLDNIVMADISLTNRGYEGELTIPFTYVKGNALKLTKKLIK